jgi:hypothetical protein
VPSGRALAPERLNPPQRLRKASQTARGFNGSDRAPLHVGRCPLGQSAKADFAIFQRRFQSLRPGACRAHGAHAHELDRFTAIRR